MNPHRPLNHGVRVYSASADAAYSQHMNTNVRFMKKKSEVMIVPSLQAVGNTAPNARHCGDSLKTLFRWKNSIYKLVWRHMLIYYLCYVSLTLVYQFLLDDKTGRKHFDVLVKYFSKSASTFNLMLMLGFFTSTTLQRLFTMQTSIPGTAKVTSLFIMSLKPDLPEGSIIVHLYARWAVLSWILAIRSVSKPIRKRYPSMITLQMKGILLERERVILERAETEGNTTPRPLVVIDWMLLLLKECSKYGRYNNKSCHHKNVETLMAFKKSCGNMIKFATRNIPHALIQAVIIAVYYFGLVTMMARDLSYPQISIQGLNTTQDTSDQKENDPDIVKIVISYFPIMPLMQFFIFFAWLTFGRMAVNPFGDDETDIDLNNLLQSHIEDYIRLAESYDINLDDVFSDLPQKRFNEVASPTNKETSDLKEKSLPKVASSPEMAVLAVSSTLIRKKEPVKETSVTIEDGDQEETTSFLIGDGILPKLQRKLPMWKGVKRQSTP